jgi:hypothetical protein
MANATERVVVLMSPAEKRALEAKAKRLGASIAQLVRRSVDAYEPQSEEIATLLETLKASHRVTLAALAKAEREVALTRRHFAARARGRGR